MMCSRTCCPNLFIAHLWERQQWVSRERKREREAHTDVLNNVVDGHLYSCSTSIEWRSYVEWTLLDPRCWLPVVPRYTWCMVQVDERLLFFFFLVVTNLNESVIKRGHLSWCLWRRMVITSAAIVHIVVCLCRKHCQTDSRTVNNNAKVSLWLIPVTLAGFVIPTDCCTCLILALPH